MFDLFWPLFLFCLEVFYLVQLFFFFVKQKTAYEMRISDWSSDVCSSDLALRILNYNCNKCLLCLLYQAIFSNLTPQHSNSSLTLLSAAPQIGRASCRERVCQYV